MIKKLIPAAIICLLLIVPSCKDHNSNTLVTIKGEEFLINGKPTYEGRYWKDIKIQGLLLNSRLVQGIFDDINDSTRYLWIYDDTKKWDADRNTNEFLANMPLWKSYGLLSFTINMQGGSPQGYSASQPWINTPYYADGSLREDYMRRLERILNKADELGMVPILGLFYFGQDQTLKDEKAVVSAVENVINWLHERNYRNILIEINNESNISYDHEILQPPRVHELIKHVQAMKKDGFSFYAGTSYGGGVIPLSNVVSASDFILIHGNGVSDTGYLKTMIDSTRKVPGYTPKPVLFNEDDHFEFDKENNNFITAIKNYASWGYFDYRMKDEKFEDGYQSVPVDWGINSERKKGFFNLLKEITGY